jgi:hypothetical protein
MTAVTTIASAVAAGITIKVDGTRLVLSAPERPGDHLLEDLRREKPAITAYLREVAAWTAEDWQALFDERAGIMEYDGGLPREEAEKHAKEETAALRKTITDAFDG